MVTFLSTLMLNVDYGLFIGTSISLFMVVVRDQLTPMRSLVKYKRNAGHYVDPSVLSDAELDIDDDDESSLSNCIYRPQHSLYFANSDAFQKKLYKEFPPDRPMSSSLIIDLAPVNYVDQNGVKIIMQIIDDYTKANSFVYICQAQGLKTSILIP